MTQVEQHGRGTEGGAETRGSDMVVVDLLETEVSSVSFANYYYLTVTMSNILLYVIMLLCHYVTVSLSDRATLSRCPLSVVPA